MHACMLSRFSCVWLFETPWTVAHQAPLSMGFSRQEYYWNGLPCPPPGGLPDPGIEPASLLSLALAGRFFTTKATWEAQSRVDLSLFFLFHPIDLWTNMSDRISHIHNFSVSFLLRSFNLFLHLPSFLQMEVSHKDLIRLRFYYFPRDIP